MVVDVRVLDQAGGEQVEVDHAGDRGRQPAPGQLLGDVLGDSAGHLFAGHLLGADRMDPPALGQWEEAS